MSRKEPITILIEGAGTATAISVLKGLKRQNRHAYRTVVLDIDDFVAGRYFAHRFYKSPPSTHDDYLNYVLEICRREGVDLYIPIIDYGFKKLSKSKSRFAAIGTHLLIANHASIEKCTDKYLTHTFFKGKDIPTPKTWKDVNDLDLGGENFPFFVKPRSGGRASIDTHKIHSAEELYFYTRNNTNYIIQQFTEGQEFTADNLSSLDGRSYIDSVVRKRVDIKGGLSTKVRMLEPEIAVRVKEYLKEIITTLRIPGACNIQGFIRPDGSIVFTEINPRFAGTHAFTIEAGLNSIECILDMLESRPLPEIRINQCLQMVRYWNEIFFEEEEGRVWTWPDLLSK